MFSMECHSPNSDMWDVKGIAFEHMEWHLDTVNDALMTLTWERHVRLCNTHSPSVLHGTPVYSAVSAVSLHDQLQSQNEHVLTEV